MNTSEDRAGEVFFQLHRDLPREGPGDDEQTLRALELARPHLPDAPTVVDVACGPGMQTICLARALPRAKLLAVDLHEPFLEQLSRAAHRADVTDRLEVRVADMGALDVESDSVDLLWCEGAAYLLGVAEALQRWRGLLKPGGCLAFTEAVWLDEVREDQRPARAVQMWQEYPAMGTVATNRDLLDAAGYARLGDFVLPASSWWTHYYAPLEARLDELEPTIEDDAGRTVLAAHREEIAVWRECSASYSYAFFVARRES